MKLCVSLDFDGVIVDTVSLLYDIYTDILQQYSVAGDEEEFESLNGANLQEIVAKLIATHELPISHKDLTNLYLAKLDKMYEKARLNPGVAELLYCLRDKKIRVALVSGGSSITIANSLERLGIRGFFDTIVSGDEVKISKPAKEIYELLKSKMPDCIYLAIEDSLNGILSAKEADINVVYYDKHRNRDMQSIRNAHHTINAFDELRVIIYAMEKGSYSVAQIASGTKIAIRNNSIGFRQEHERLIHHLWSESLKQNDKLFNGRILCYLSSIFNHDSLEINVFDSDYKHFRFKDQVFAQSGIKISPLAVSGIITDKYGNTLIGVRSNVTQYEGWIELIPSGSISYSASGETNTPEEQILLELFEETKINRELVQSVEAFCLVYDGKDDVYDIGFEIVVNDDLSHLLSVGAIQSSEYVDIQVISIQDLKMNLERYHIVPTSASLLCLLCHI